MCMSVSVCLFLYFCIMGTSAGASLSLCLRCLCPVLFRSLLILAHKNRLSSSLRNSVSRWVAWNQPLRKYLHHRNWQMLPVSMPPTKSPKPKHYQHFPAYHDPWLMVPKVAVEASLLKFLKLYITGFHLTLQVQCSYQTFQSQNDAKPKRQLPIIYMEKCFSILRPKNDIS